MQYPPKLTLYINVIINCISVKAVKKRLNKKSLTIGNIFISIPSILRKL